MEPGTEHRSSKLARRALCQRSHSLSPEFALCKQCSHCCFESKLPTTILWLDLAGDTVQPLRLLVLEFGTSRGMSPSEQGGTGSSCRHGVRSSHHARKKQGEQTGDILHPPRLHPHPKPPQRPTLPSSNTPKEEHSQPTYHSSCCW